MSAERRVEGKFDYVSAKVAEEKMKDALDSADIGSPTMMALTDLLTLSEAWSSRDGMIFSHYEEIDMLTESHIRVQEHVLAQAWVQIRNRSAEINRYSVQFQRYQKLFSALQNSYSHLDSGKEKHASMKKATEITSKLRQARLAEMNPNNY